MRVKEVLLLSAFNVLFVQVLSHDAKTLYTVGYYYSQYFPLEENLSPEGFFRFSVRAPRDAHILLAPTHDADEPVYEVVLGAQNNTVNHIRGRCPCQEEPSATVRTVNLLSSKKFCNFWVRIKSEKFKTFVQVGLGDSETPFHEWRDPRPIKPQYLSFRSATVAEWRYGYKDSTYNKGTSTDRRQSIVTSTGFGQYFSLSDVVSHSADGATLYFTARAAEELQVLFSPEVSTLGDIYLVGIHEEGAYIRKRLLGENRAALQQQHFLNKRERLRFWIKITSDGIIMFGKGSSSNPLLQWRDPYPISPQYLSFSMHQDSSQEYDPSVYADVQYGLGPDYTLSSQDCAARWMESANKLTPGAVRGGRYNDRELFVCRARHNDDVVPGNYVVDEDKRGGCYISYNFSIFVKNEFEILTGCKMKWVSTSLGRIPDGSIVGGSRRGNPMYYVARVEHEGAVIIGKVKTEERIAYVSYNGQELPFTNYEILLQLAGEDSRGGTTRRSPTSFPEIPSYNIRESDNSRSRLAQL